MAALDLSLSSALPALLDAAPLGSALTKGQSHPFPALWADLLFRLFVHSHLQLFLYMYEWCISVPVICTVVLGPGEATAG